MAVIFKIPEDFRRFAAFVLKERCSDFTLQQTAELIESDDARETAAYAGVDDFETIVSVIAALNLVVNGLTPLRQIVEQSSHAKVVQSWTRVSGGLRFTQTGLMVVWALMITLDLMQAGLVVFGVGGIGQREIPVLMASALGLVTCLLIAAILWVFIGQLRCCAAPMWSGSKNLAVLSAACYVASPLVGIVTILALPSPSYGQDLTLPEWLVQIAKLGFLMAGTVALIAHTIFLAALGRMTAYFKETSLGGYRKVFIVLCYLTWIGTWANSMLGPEQLRLQLNALQSMITFSLLGFWLWLGC